MGDEKKISSIRQRTHKQVDNMMDQAEGMGERGREEVARMKEKVMMMKEQVDEYIQKKPGTAVLIAAGIGLAAGAILAATLIRRKR